jgi:hypothetical protein
MNVPLKCILILLFLLVLIKLSKRKEPFTGSRKAGAIQMYRDPDDYDYRLLGVKTKALCATKDRNLSNALKHHKPDPKKAGSLDFDKVNYTDGIKTVSLLPSIDRDDLNRFPKFKHKKRKFPPIEKTSYYPYENILSTKKK